MIRQKSKGLLIVISGPSGAGKDTVCNRVIEEMKDTKISISMTSREPRGKEVDGVEYYFVSKEEFEERIKNNEFLEYAVVHNNQYYGTPKGKIEEDLSKGKNVILVIDIQGALKVKETVPEALFIFIMPPSMEELKDRLIKRQTESKKKILERFKTAYNEINEYTKYNYVVVNDKVDKAVEKVKSIIIAEKCRVDRIEEISMENEEEILHEFLIDNKEFENKPMDITKEK